MRGGGYYTSVCLFLGGLYYTHTYVIFLLGIGGVTIHPSVCFLGGIIHIFMLFFVKGRGYYTYVCLFLGVVLCTRFTFIWGGWVYMLR